MYGTTMSAPAESRIAARGMVMAVAFMMVLAWPVPAAQAAPPDVDAQLEFVIGSEVGHNYQPEYPWDVGFAAAVLHVDLGGFDVVAPPASWSVDTWFAGMAPENLASGTVGAYGTDLDVSIPVGLTDYDDDFGGGTFRVTHWQIDAANGAGESTTVMTEAGMVVVQQDGINARFDAPATGVTVTTRGRWRTSTWHGWLNGTTAWTVRKWAKMSFEATVSEGQVIAVVMPMAENRGEAKIKLDGVNQGRVDTYVEGPRRHRIIVWQTPPLTAGTHTIDVINLATEGHPRIDVDAIMIAGG